MIHTFELIIDGCAREERLPEECVNLAETLITSSQIQLQPDLQCFNVFHVDASKAQTVEQLLKSNDIAFQWAQEYE
jgi:hypothetical protein